MSNNEEKFKILESSDPKELWQAKERIDTFYEEYTDILQEMENEVANLYSTNMTRYILNSAVNIRTTFKCPPGWKEGFPWVNMFPPAPQPEHMRNGILAKLAETATYGEKEEEKDSVSEEEKQRAIETVFTLKERLAILLKQSTSMDTADDVEGAKEYYEEGEEDEDGEYDEEGEGEEMHVEDTPYDRNKASENVSLVNANLSAMEYSPTDETNMVAAAPTQQRRVVAAMDFGNFGDDSDEEDE